MKNDDFMKKVIIVLGLFLLIFTIIMIVVFIKCQQVPDVLITAVFTASLGEGSLCGMLQKTKIQNNIGANTIEDDEEVEDDADDDEYVVMEED